MSKQEDDRRRHEYLLQEIRLTGEDIKAAISEKYEPRISSLETTRTYAKGIVKAVGVGAPAVGSIAWFCWEFGKMFGSHISKGK